MSGSRDLVACQILKSPHTALNMAMPVKKLKLEVDQEKNPISGILAVAFHLHSLHCY